MDTTHKTVTAVIKNDLADAMTKARGHLSINQYLKFLVMKDIDDGSGVICILDPCRESDAERIAELVRGR